MKLFKYIIRRFYYFKSFLKFKSVGTNVILSSGGYIIRPEEITFGNNVFIGFEHSSIILVFLEVLDKT